MEDGQGFGATRSAYYSDLPHRSRQGCNFSFAERLEPCETYFQEFTHLYETNFLGVHVLLVVCDAVLWDVSCYFLSFCQRPDPLVIIKLFRGWFFLLLQEHHLYVEWKAALFREVSIVE